MGVRILAKTADFSASNTGRKVELTSVRINLIAECLFGRNLATSRINSAGDTVDFTEHGTPVYEDGYATFGWSTGWLNTFIADQANLTLMCVFNFGSSAASKAILSTTNDASTGQVAISTSGGGVYAGQYKYGTASPYTSRFLNLTPATPIGENRAVAYRLSGTTNVVAKLDEYKNGARTGGASYTSTDTRPLAPTTVAVGSIRTSALATSSNFVSLLAWSEALSDADLLTAYLSHRTALMLLGRTC